MVAGVSLDAVSPATIPLGQQRVRNHQQLRDYCGWLYDTDERTRVLDMTIEEAINHLASPRTVALRIVFEQYYNGLLQMQNN